MSTPVSEKKKQEDYAIFYKAMMDAVVSCSNLNEGKVALKCAKDKLHPMDYNYLMELLTDAFKEMPDQPELKRQDGVLSTYRVPLVTPEECEDSDSSMYCVESSDDEPVLTLKECEEHGKMLDDTVQKIRRRCVDWAAHGNGCASDFELSEEDDVRALAWIIQERGPGFKLAACRLAVIVLVTAREHKVCLSCGIPTDSFGHLLCSCIVQRAEKEMPIRTHPTLKQIMEAGLGGTVDLNSSWIGTITATPGIGNDQSLSGLHLLRMSALSDGSSTDEVEWGSL